MDGLHWWLAPLALVAVWWLAGRPGWPRGRTPPHEPDSTELPMSRQVALDDAAPAIVGATDAADPPPVADAAPPLPAAEAADAAAAAARATEDALREAQESARRELAARERQEREAAAREAAERDARRRAEVERLAAEAAAREQAERVAEQARQRAAELEREAEARRRAEAEREAAAREAALRELEAREAAAREAAAREAEARETAAREAEAREAAAREDAAREAAAREAAAREAAAREAAAREAAAREAAAREAAAREAEAARLAALVPPAAPAPRQAAQTLVMVADDSKVVRVKTSRLLAAHQFRVVLAEDGEQALSLMAQEPPQVLITDVEMPGMDGLQLTRTVRADARTAALPVVMITSSDDRLREEADAAGVTVLMGKPYADLDLIGHVARLAGVTLGPR